MSLKPLTRLEHCSFEYPECAAKRQQASKASDARKESSLHALCYCAAVENDRDTPESKVSFDLRARVDHSPSYSG